MQILIPTLDPVVRFPVVMERQDGRALALLQGDNGAGKTTLLRLLLGLVEDSNGKPQVVWNDTTYEPSKDRRLLRYLPQNPEEGLFTRMSVHENVLLLSKLLGIDAGALPAVKELENRAIPAWRLSVGQKKLILLEAVIASAMSSDGSNPLVVVLDEPFAGLDNTRRQRAFAVLEEAVSSLGDRPVLFLVVDHAHASAVDSGPVAVFQIRPGIELTLTPARGLQPI